MNSEMLSKFLFKNSEIIFDKPKKISLDKACRSKFSVNMFVHFGLLGSISDKPKTIGDDQNFVLSLNTGLEILYLLLCKNSEESFWKA